MFLVRVVHGPVYASSSRTVQVWRAHWTLAQAQEHRSAGRLDAAELLYRQVLSIRPDDPEALDGLRATTHWIAAGLLAAAHPDVEVDPDVLYVDNGQILTSAGAAAGLALCLHMIRSDMLVDLGASSKLNAEWAFLSLLRDEGRRAADAFLTAHGGDLGRRSTLDIDRLLEGV